MRELIKIF